MDEREQKILETIKGFTGKLPVFPDGRIDYSNSDTAPVITVFMRYKDKILLLKRSNEVLTHKGKWSTVAGYLDELKPIQEKALEEIREETGVKEDIISKIHIGKPYKFKDTEANKIWLRHPILVELRDKPDIKIDWEHTEYRWIKPEELKEFDTVPRLDRSFEDALK